MVLIKHTVRMAIEFNKPSSGDPPPSNMTKTKGTCEFAATSKGLALNTSRRSDSETGDTPGHTGSLAAFILELKQRLEEQDQMDDSRASFLPDGARQTCGHNYFSRNPYDVDDSPTNSSTRYTRPNQCIR